MIISNALVRWLANGRRGVSSNTIVTHLTGINALSAWVGASHPLDPDDMTRCRWLLKEVPELAANFPDMRTCSPEWAQLVKHWDEICQLMDSEFPKWEDGRYGGSCPKTYRLMRELIDTARLPAPTVEEQS